MRYDNIILFTYQRYVIKKNIDIRTFYEQNDHEYVIGTVGTRWLLKRMRKLRLSLSFYPTFLEKYNYLVF